MHSLSSCIYSMQQPDPPQQAELLFSAMGFPQCSGLTEGWGHLLPDTFGARALQSNFHSAAPCSVCTECFVPRLARANLLTLCLPCTPSCAVFQRGRGSIGSAGRGIRMGSRAPTGAGAVAVYLLLT